MKRILSCDVGTKVHGFALSDLSQKLVTKTWTKKIRASSSSVISEEALEQDVDLIVLGLPLRMSGGDSDMSIHVREIAENLKFNGFKVDFIDERLTTDRKLDSVKRNESSAKIILEMALKKKIYYQD
tara:strand:+ start:6275 stop:6655 length:381 start_codon:yes stop_codon:yes gene_type:complete